MSKGGAGGYALPADEDDDGEQEYEHVDPDDDGDGMGDMDGEDQEDDEDMEGEDDDGEDMGEDEEIDQQIVNITSKNGSQEGALPDPNQHVNSDAILVINNQNNLDQQ